MRPFKLMYRFNAISIQNSPGYFIDYDKFIVKFTWKNKKTKMTKNIIFSNDGDSFSSFTLYY